MQCKNNTFIDSLFTFKWIIKNNYHKYTLWNSTIPNTNYLSSTPTDMRNGRENLAGIIREKMQYDSYSYDEAPEDNAFQ